MGGQGCLSGHSRYAVLRGPAVRGFQVDRHRLLDGERAAAWTGNGELDRQRAAAERAREPAPVRGRPADPVGD